MALMFILPEELQQFILRLQMVKDIRIVQDATNILLDEFVLFAHILYCVSLNKLWNLLDC